MKENLCQNKAKDLWNDLTNTNKQNKTKQIANIKQIRASLIAQLVKNPLQCRRPQFHSWLGKIPWKRDRLSTPVLWPGEFQGLSNPWGRKESDMTKWRSLTKANKTLHVWFWLFLLIIFLYRGFYEKFNENHEKGSRKFKFFLILYVKALFS